MHCRLTVLPVSWKEVNAVKAKFHYADFHQNFSSGKVVYTNHESRRTFMICVRDKSATLSGTCPGLCRKVGVMEFGLYWARSVAGSWDVRCWFSPFLKTDRPLCTNCKLHKYEIFGNEPLRVIMQNWSDPKSFSIYLFSLFVNRIHVRPKCAKIVFCSATLRCCAPFPNISCSSVCIHVCIMQGCGLKIKNVYLSSVSRSKIAILVLRFRSRSGSWFCKGLARKSSV